jgi:hypothetical protein
MKSRTRDEEARTASGTAVSPLHIVDEYGSSRG